jgi:hypothetical protein
VGGRFERGSRAIRGASVASEEIDIATIWSDERGAPPTGTRVSLALQPALEAPIDLASPATSAETRDAARALEAGARAVHFKTDAIEALLDGPADDPEALQPVLEKLVRVARAVRGIGSAGPFR